MNSLVSLSDMTSSNGSVTFSNIVAFFACFVKRFKASHEGWESVVVDKHDIKHALQNRPSLKMTTN